LASEGSPTLVLIPYLFRAKYGKGEKQREPVLSTLPSDRHDINPHSATVNIYYGKVTTTAKVVIFSRMDGIKIEQREGSFIKTLSLIRVTIY
jgi:hypothetical protein